MNNEIQLIITALTQLGPEAKQAFYWWLLADKVIPAVFFFIVVMTILWIVWRMVAKEIE